MTAAGAGCGPDSGKLGHSSHDGRTNPGTTIQKIPLNYTVAASRVAQHCTTFYSILIQQEDKVLNLTLVKIKECWYFQKMSESQTRAGNQKKFENLKI